MVPELCRAPNGISEVVGLRRKAIVIVVKRRSIVVDDGPILFLPMGGEEDDGFGLWILLLYLLELFVEEGVLLLVDERHGASSMRDEDRCHGE